MKHRRLRATKLFDGQQFLPDQVLEVAPDGTIENVVPYREEEEVAIETYDGILMPGMINSHCHLELSHFKGLIPCGTGLVEFLMCVVRNRKDIPLAMDKIVAAERELYVEGIAGVADICNTADALAVKQGSPIQWHNLIEVLNFRDENLAARLEQYREVAEAHRAALLSYVLTPHAPYSVSRGTFEALNEATAGSIISVHNQETRAENELFRNGSGDFLKLYTEFNTSLSPFEEYGGTSLQAWLPHFTNRQTILLVHNTFIEEEDILFAAEHAAKYGLTLVYCLCPNANLYIENALPPIDLLIRHNCSIVLGTDSYSSNWRLSIASEIATIRKHFPHIALDMILQWATANGANALGWPHLGRLAPGLKPGIILLNEADYSIQRLY